MNNHVPAHVSNATRQVKRRLVTAEVIATELQFSTKWVYHAVKAMGMPHYRVGRYVRFDLDEVLEWVRDGRADIY